MDAASTTYIETILAAIVVVVVAVTLFYLGRRARKEATFIGFQAKSKDEKYTGYSLFTAGMAITLFSIYQILALFAGGLSTRLFGLSDIVVVGNGQSSVLVSSGALSLFAGVIFWLLLMVFGGRKIAAIGLDLVKGRKIKLRKVLRTPEGEIDAV